jgi:hypothetical protein|nr:MAG TPA: hypothetical protein [Caudoviricetes sp.]
MADAILMSGGVGGVSSDDVTAKRWHVVQGFTALTSDSDDEPANGELANKGNGGASNGVICPEMFYYTLEGAYTARFDAGAYYNAGERGQWKPYVSVPVWMVKNATNYHPEKTLSDTVTCQERGTVKMIDTKANNYTANQAKLIGMDPGRGKFVMQLGHGNAYYYRDDNNPHVEVDASALGNAVKESVLQGQTASSQHGINFQGTIPRWICNTGDVITALGGEGFAWDDTHANRGRGIVVKIPNGRYIQGANWVFLPSPNHLPHNIVKDININGVTGTRDWADRTNEYAISSNVSVSQLQNNQPIALGNAFSGSETLFIGVDLVGVDVDGGLVRRDKGNGRRNIGRILLGKNDSNFVATFIRRCPVQIELSRDWAGNMSFILHIPDGWNFGQTQFYVYIYGHSSMQNNL